MSHTEVYNVNVASQDVLITPARLKQALPMSPAARAQVTDSREVIGIGFLLTF